VPRVDKIAAQADIVFAAFPAAATVTKTYYRAETFVSRKALGYLIRRLNNLIIPHAEALFADQELTFSQWVALVSLRDGLNRTCADIARHLNHDSGATTRMIDQLEARGLVTRTRSKEDRRVIALSLTTEGRAVAKAMAPRIMEFWNDVLENFSSAETANLIELLTRLLENIEAKLSIPPVKPRSAR
jgi:DNA-binding MarR family transcriptional regulator